MKIELTKEEFKAVCGAVVMAHNNAYNNPESEKMYRDLMNKLQEYYNLLNV